MTRNDFCDECCNETIGKRICDNYGSGTIDCLKSETSPLMLSCGVRVSTYIGSDYYHGYEMPVSESDNYKLETYLCAGGGPLTWYVTYYQASLPADILCLP